MTLQEAIDRFDQLYPNAMAQHVKRRILSDFDGRLYTEVLSLYEGAPASFSGYGEEAAPHTPLLAEYPYDDIYVLLLCAENDAVNGDIERYNNAAMMLNAAYERYVNHLNRTRRRKQSARITC